MREYNIPNAPENLQMSDILAKYPEGLAKSCRFAVRITPSSSPFNRMLGASTFMSDLTYVCEAAELPGRALAGIDLRYYGPTFRLPYQSTYEDVNLTFLVRSDSRERIFFDDWMNLINPIQSWDFSYRVEYAAKIQIFQLSDTNTLKDNPTAPEATYAITMIDTYPVAISAQPMTWSDDNFQRLIVTFTHDGWYREGADQWPPRTNSLISGARINASTDGKYGR